MKNTLFRLETLRFKTSELVSATITFDSEVDDCIVTQRDIKRMIDLLDAQKPSFSQGENI